MSTPQHAPAKVHKIGVMTGGGDCPGLNAVIRAVTRSAILKYGWEVIGIQGAFLGLLQDGEPNLMPLTLQSIRGILPQGGTILGTTNRAHPFRYPVKQDDGATVYEDRSEFLLQRLQQLEIDALVMIGGDGTMALAQQLVERGIPVVGVPKTIDNDLDATDYTFGFDSACNVAMEAVDRLHTTADSHGRIMLCEVMGRHAGWIALHAGVAGGADVILIPEIPYAIDKIIAKIKERAARGSHFSIIVVAEGAKPAGGDISLAEDNLSLQKRLGGAAERIASQLSPFLESDVRVTVLGHVQRGGSPTHFDRILGTRFGEEAVELIAAGKMGHMVTLRGIEVQDCPIQEAIARPKVVNPESQTMRAARALGISFGD